MNRAAILLLLFLVLFGAQPAPSAPLVRQPLQEAPAEAAERRAGCEPGRLVFYRSRPNGSAGQLWIMDGHGADPRPLGKSGARPDHYPSWSPDGTRIAFESYRQGGWRVWIMEADGSQARRLMTGRSGTGSYEFDPSFSSDGRHVLFVSGGDLQRVAVEGGAPQRITETPDVFEFSPQESPDGSRIVFCARVDDGFGIFSVDRDGANRTRLSRSSSIDYAPQWSHDGRTLAFYSDRDGSFEPYLAAADGSNARPLLSREQRAAAGFTDTAFVHAFDNDWGAMTQYKLSFSCDDARIAFSRELDGNREIFTVGVDGGDLERLTSNELHDGFPAAAPCAGH